MRKFLTLKRLVVVIIVLFLLIQVFRIDKVNPPVNQSDDFIAITKPDAEIAGILRAACYDCHSNETKYPWYTNIAPVSWWLKNHIDEGREELNFSEWGTFNAARKAKKLKKAAKEVKEGEMPLDSYTWLHREAKLTDAQKAALVNWFSSVTGGSAQPAIAEDLDED